MTHDPTDEFRSSVPTRGGIPAPLGDIAVAGLITEFSKAYSRLPEGEPILVIRQVQNPRQRSLIAVVMVLAKKPIGSDPSAMTERGFEFPVEKFVVSGNGEQSELVNGPILFAAKELSDSRNKVFFGATKIREWALTTPASPGMALTGAEEFIYMKLRDMAAMIELVLPPI
jgi:hypothetical protein